METSVGFERILAEARKYNLCLAGLANQYVGQLTYSVRQAIFGNIGVMIAFRMGVEDANIVAKEMGVFEASELMNLELGEAVARAGSSKTAYNLHTYPDPPVAGDHVTPIIRERMHRRFARPRDEVERNLDQPQPTGGPPLSEPHKQRKPKGTSNAKSQPRDPNEDDFIN
jgi:hypothetical protein